MPSFSAECLFLLWERKLCLLYLVITLGFFFPCAKNKELCVGSTLLLPDPEHCGLLGKQKQNRAPSRTPVVLKMLFIFRVKTSCSVDARSGMMQALL